ncbi:transporter [Porphyromonas cangingivalis]|uniref:Transporter n=1 Tax=Porphyromonas cangingivalis TaxID=36874 RepID=A0A0A2EN16_PORCN|nr:TolC family protein [Porphyromonas cangingivalis]KGN80251.1 transporter [Porphyromonas cangingivalis]
MRTILSFILSLTLPLSICAQSDIDRVLKVIEQNNTTLKGLRETAEADKLANKTEIYLSNPEVEYGHHWGKPTEIGNRTALNVTQTFDIATLTGMKSRLARDKNTLIDRQYRSDRMAILLEAKQTCIDLIYCNALREELSMRLRHAELIADGYKSRMEKGDANIIEYNKIRLNVTRAQNELRLIEIERQTLLLRLRRLNGDIDISFGLTTYPATMLPTDFDTWYSHIETTDPTLAHARQEIEVSKRQLSLTKAMGLPSFSAGYASEKVGQEDFKGISVGITIPLWENKNKVRHAKASIRAAEARANDTHREVYNRLKSLYNRTAGLRDIAHSYRNTLSQANNADLLKKAHDAGELSLLDYILEIGIYYDTVNQMLTAERDYQKALAELYATEL